MSRHVRDGLSVLALLSIFGSAACFMGHSRERPPTWPGPVEVRDDTCPDLSGTYQDEALPDPFVPQIRWLSDLVKTDQSPAATGSAGHDPTTAGRRVAIGRFEKNVTTGEVHYTAQPSLGRQPPALVFSKGIRFECRDGSLVATPPVHGANGNVCGVWTTRRLQFWRLGDGDLILRSSGVDYCFLPAFLIFWDAEWYRFRQAAPSASAP